MDIRFSSSLRRKKSENKIPLDSKLQEIEKHYNNTVIKHTSKYS